MVVGKSVLCMAHVAMVCTLMVVVLQTGYAISTIFCPVSRKQTLRALCNIRPGMGIPKPKYESAHTHKRAIIITCPSPQAPPSPANTHVYTHTHTCFTNLEQLAELFMIRFKQKLSLNHSFYWNLLIIVTIDSLK